MADSITEKMILVYVMILQKWDFKGFELVQVLFGKLLKETIKLRNK